MVNTAWEHLARRCTATEGGVDWEWMHQQMTWAVRKAIRDYSAFMHDLPISAYGRYVSACHIRGIGAEYWPETTRFRHLAEVYNTSGDDDDIARREQHHRCLDPDDLEAIARWIQGSRVTFDPEWHHHTPPAVDDMLTTHDLQTSLTTATHLSPAALALAHAYIDELSQALREGASPEALTHTATRIGLRGGTRDRAIASVRHHLRRSLSR